MGINRKYISIVFMLLFSISLVSSVAYSFDDDDKLGIFNVTNINFLNASIIQVGPLDVCLSDGTNCVAGSGDNASWNQTGADLLYIAQGDESNLNVNSSDHWDDLNTFNATQMEDNGGVLNILESWFSSLFDTLFGTKDTDDLAEGTNNLYDNKSWNETGADLLYADISVTGDNESWNESLANDLYWNINGDNTTGDYNVDGSFNISQNLTIGDSIIQDDYFIKAKPSNEFINGEIFTINSNATTTNPIPFVGFQPGGPGQASWVGGSLMLVNRNESILNIDNASSCQAQADSHGIELKIDCNSSSPENPLGTGPDFLGFGDIQISGESWLRNTEGEWRFFTRVLELLDENFEDILFNDAVLSIENGNLNINETKNETLVVNLNRTETIFDIQSDSIALNTGSNISPSINHVTYQDPTNPTLTIDTSEPSVSHAEIAIIYIGEDTDNIYLFENTISHNEKFTDQVYDTFGDLGGIYLSGLDQSMSTTQLNISDGIVRLRINKKTYSNNLVSTEDFFYINSTGNFIQCVDNTCLTKYTDDTDIGNNKYFSLVWGVVPIGGDGQQRLMVILQGNPGLGKEYTSSLDAEEDPLSKVNFFPSNSDFKGAFIPVARTIHKRSGNNDFAVFTTTGELFQDLRGKATVASGGVPSPPITDHDLLDNLAWNVSGHESTSNLTNTGFDIIADKFYGLFNWTVLTNWFSFDGATLSFNETKLNNTIALEGVRVGFNNTFNTTYDAKNSSRWDLVGSDIVRETGNVNITNTLNTNVTCIGGGCQACTYWNGTALISESPCTQ